MNVSEDEEGGAFVRAVKKLSERQRTDEACGGGQHVVMDGEEGE